MIASVISLFGRKKNIKVAEKEWVVPIYTEGILWYLLLLDCLVYNFLAWWKKKGRGKEKERTHWISAYFPINKFLGLGYLLLTLWLGFALYRMQLLGFYLR